ncbi:MAG: dolichyl-phosphate beta-glucosyltransferase [bacterium]
MHLSVVIPAYNEEKRISKTLRSINEYLKKQNYLYEILVVSDGSKDNTAKVVNDLTSEIKNLRLIDNKQNKGKGYVVRQGIMVASGKYRLFTDADNSTSIDQIEKMWPWFEKGKFDVVIGSRDLKDSILDPPQSWLRHFILGEGFKLFRKLVVGLWGMEDTQCGFKCFSDKMVEEVFPKCVIDRFAFDPEILIVAKKKGYKIKEMPVCWKNDLSSTVKFNGIIKMALDMFKIKFNNLKGIYN